MRKAAIISCCLALLAASCGENESGRIVIKNVQKGDEDTLPEYDLAKSPAPHAEIDPEMLAAPQPNTHTNSQPRRPKTPLSYHIVQQRDVSFANAVRTDIRVRVSRKCSGSELEIICRVIIPRIISRRPHNAIAFGFYLPGTDTTGSCTAGKAEWAPDGKWERADNVRTGDYSRHQLVVNAGSAVGEFKGEIAPRSSSSSIHHNPPITEGLPPRIPEQTRRRIYWDLVALQDTRPDDPAFSQEAYGVIARRYGVSKDSIYRVAGEGVKKGWPLPPLKP